MTKIIHPVAGAVAIYHDCDFLPLDGSHGTVRLSCDRYAR